MRSITSSSSGRRSSSRSRSHVLALAQVREKMVPGIEMYIIYTACKARFRRCFRSRIEVCFWRVFGSICNRVAEHSACRIDLFIRKELFFTCCRLISIRAMHMLMLLRMFMFMRILYISFIFIAFMLFFFSSAAAAY